jgi:hypothetical protein
MPSMLSTAALANARVACKADDRLRTMTTDRILAIADAFDDLHALVVGEPALSEFVAATSLLRALGDKARVGEPIELVVPSQSSARIPTRELAQQILAIVNRTPGPLGHEDPATTRTMGLLHANLARAVVYALFIDYPELMRH